jgi:hypothetical protein
MSFQSSREAQSANDRLNSRPLFTGGALLSVQVHKLLRKDGQLIDVVIRGFLALDHLEPHTEGGFCPVTGVDLNESLAGVEVSGGDGDVHASSGADVFFGKHERTIPHRWTSSTLQTHGFVTKPNQDTRDDNGC